MSFRIYVASSSQDGERCRHWERELRKAGAVITSTWSHDCEKWPGKDHLLPRRDQRNQAVMCMRQIVEASALWLLVPEAPHITIGAYVELGIAASYQRPIFVSGARCNASAFFGLARMTSELDSEVFRALCRLTAETTQPMTPIGARA